jgi:hypothetical protein
MTCFFVFIVTIIRVTRADELSKDPSHYDEHVENERNKRFRQPEQYLNPNIGY